MDEVNESSFDTKGVKKRFMFVNRRAPYGTIYALEILEMVLVSAAFEQHAAIVFMDDGVYQIKKGHDTTTLGMKNFSPTYGVIEMEKEDADEDPDLDMVWRIIVEKESMEARGLAPDDFVIGVEVMGAEELSELMNAQDVVISA
ncbi:MAG: DsrE family protein [Proteobacteria bacterium]|nr:DsrE family protein [Pseudomonadota bacterium]